MICRIAFSCDQCCAESTHDTGNVRTDRLTVCNPLKASKNSVVIERTALYNNVASELSCVRNFNYLVQCIFDNRAGKSGGDIGNRSPLFLRLLYLGVHKYGTARSKINRVFCKQRFMCEILYAVV